MSRGNDLWAANRRRTLKSLAAAAAATSLPGTSWGRARPAAPTNYNVVWLMADEHNPFATGYAGDPRAITPNLNTLAARSTNFRSAYTSNPICVPARQAIQTGRMSSNINWRTIATSGPNFKGLGPFLTQKGLKTAWFGKQHWDLDGQNPVLGPHLAYQTMKSLQSPAKKAFEKKFGLGSYPGDDELNRKIECAQISEVIQPGWTADLNEDSLCTEEAIKFLDGVGSQQFFLGVSYVKPHFPFVIQQAFYNLYAAQTLPRPAVTPAMFQNLSTALKRDWDKYGIGNLTPAQCDFARMIYYAMISYIDGQIGAVLDKLTNLGLRENTIVIYVSDHGEMMGQHHIWYKNAFLEGSARVPMLISLPGVTTSQTIQAPVSLIDLYPTLCDLLGFPYPRTPAGDRFLEGTSLVPLIDGSDDGSTRTVYSENKRYGIAARCIRTPKWKYCWYDPVTDEGYTDGNGNFYPPKLEQLYDMRGADRDIEGTDLSSDPTKAELKASLKERALRNWNPDGLFDGGD